MNYNFNITMTTDISSTIVEEIIKKIVEEQTGKKISSIEVKLRQVQKGIGPNESIDTVFDGYNIVFVEESTKGNKQPNTGFKPAVYQ
jgi:hypothetical protein